MKINELKFKLFYNNKFNNLLMNLNCRVRNLTIIT